MQYLMQLGTVRWRLREACGKADELLQYRHESLYADTKLARSKTLILAARELSAEIRKHLTCRRRPDTYTKCPAG